MYGGVWRGRFGRTREFGLVSFFIGRHPMKALPILRTAILALMLGLGVANMLTACTIETDWRHDHTDHSDLYR